ncbi:hypothetical protein [Streptomyces sp. NPDC091649]|uniref:hypothetical protein n=1 Tax=Streptomyces sp. NPDC091649 TaxID=3366004 RepID=UPI0038282B3C
MSADMVAAHTADDAAADVAADTPTEVRDAVVESGTGTVVDIATGTPVDTAADAVETTPAAGGVAAGTLRQVFAVLPLRRAVPDLVSGSWVLAGMGCGCVARALRWAWDQASDDPEAAAALAAYTKRAQAVEKVEGEEERAAALAALAALGAAPSGRRPALEALAYLALGGMLAAGAVATLAAVTAPYLAALAEWRLGLLAAGGLGWSVAAWSVAPPPPTPKTPADTEADGDVQDGAADDQDPEEARGTALLWHLVAALSGAESAGRAGLHLDVVLDSAIEAGLLPATTEQAEWRTWVESCGIPVEDKVGYRIAGKPTTRVGVRIDAATTALGMTPTALLAARPQTPAGGGPATPARPVGERHLPAPAETAPATPEQPPVQTPAGAPVPAALRLLPGGRQHPVQTLSPTAPQGSAQEAR